MRVVVKCNVVKTVAREKAIGDAGEQIVCDHQVVTTTRLIWVISAEQLQRLVAVLHGVVREGDVLDCRPRRETLFAADGEQNGITNLRVSPTVFKHVAVDRYVASILKLQQVFDRPVNAGVTRRTHLPGQRLEEGGSASRRGSC